MTAATAIRTEMSRQLGPEVLSLKEPGAAVAALRDHPLFQHMSDADFDWISHQVRPVNLESHELLYHQDTAARHFYFVISGRLRLYRLDFSGFERTLDSLGPGDCFAEVMIYANPARYACYAESLKRSRVLMIPIHAYRDLLRRRPEYTETALAHFASRAVARFHDLEIMTIQNARERLVRYLLDLLPETAGEDQEIELPLPKCLVASRLAMQPETFSRLLTDLKSNGLVKVNRSRLLITDVGRLKQLIL